MGARALATRGMGVAAAAAVIAAGTQLLLAPTAGAAEGSISDVGYTCKADNVLIDATLGGPQQFRVNASAPLPDSITGGEQIPQTLTSIDLILPPPLVTNIRERMNVTRVAGTATSKVVIQAVAKETGKMVEEMTPDVVGLRSGWVNIPASGSVTIPAQGTVAAIGVPELPAGDGLVYVSLPATFKLHALLDPPVINQGTEANPAHITCQRNEHTRATRVVGTIPVGNGCTETECPLPAEGSATNPGGGGGDDDDNDNGTGGTGNGEDPEQINYPTAPTPTADDDDPPGSNDDDDDDSDVAPYTTTSLPATGSPVGIGLVALLGAAAVGRIALAVRTRRRAKA